MESTEEGNLRARLQNPDDLGVPGSVSTRLRGRVDEADIESTIRAVEFLRRRSGRLNWPAFVGSDEAARTRVFSEAEANGRLTPLDVARTMRVIALLRQQDDAQPSEPASPAGSATAGPSRR